MTYTPGPWRVHESKLGTVLSPRDETVALVGGDVEGSPVANARLIALAPELVEALRRCEHCCAQAAVFGDGMVGSNAGMWDAAAQEAHSLLDKLEES